MNRIWLLGILLLMWGCKTTGSISDSGPTSFSAYEENLSSSLPDYPDFKSRVQKSEPQQLSSSMGVDGHLKEVQKRIYDKNKTEPYLNGFTVLVYSGVDRNAAFRTRDDLAVFFPDITPDIQYQQPRYLVKMGQFTYKIEAQKAFSRIRAQFPTARIIQDRFQRKEYVPPVITDPNAQGQN